MIYDLRFMIWDGSGALPVVRRILQIKNQKS